MPDIELLGATYPDVPAVDLPKSGGGTARFYDVSGALCTITAEYDEVEEYDEVYTSDKTAQEVYDALEVGINPVFRFHNLLDTDAYIYASLTKLESTADGEELTLSSFQTDAMTAATANDVFTLTVQGEPPPVEKTVSGSLITITDALAEPAVALSTAINPVQSGSGDPSPTNVRPISGFSAANIVVSPTTTAGDGTTYTVSFGTAGTVYGGTLDVVNGTLTVDRALIVADGVNVKCTGGYAGGASRIPGINISSQKGDFEKRNLIISSYLAYANYPQNVENSISMFNSGDWIALHINDIKGIGSGTPYSTDADLQAAANAYLQDNPLQIAYPLATPTVITLTPTEVQMLLGTNNVWSDTNGDVTLTYLADGNVSASSALNMLLGGTYTPSADVSNREALQIIMGETT